MTANLQLKYEDNPRSKERIFFLCEDCLWSMTVLDKSRLGEIIGRDNTCPRCWQDDISSFPLVLNESFTYEYSENRGIDIKFGRQK
ncbi:MAG: hypothetical protein ACM3ZS_11920 [Nitrososphaerota archaeon]